jgi:hypothetical protein
MYGNLHWIILPCIIPVVTSIEASLWDRSVKPRVPEAAGGPRATQTLSNVVTITTATECEKCSSSRSITLELELPQKRVTSVFLHPQLYSEHFPAENTSLSTWLSSVTDRRILFGHSIPCAIWRWHVSRKHFRIYTVYIIYLFFGKGVHYVEFFWRKILFNLYVSRRFTSVSSSLCNNNCNVVLITTTTTTTTTTTNETQVPTPQVI